MFDFFVVALDSQVVNVALPSIRHNLGGGLSGLQWVVTGYTMMFSALILFAGTFSERVGAKHAYAARMILFVIASAACGASPTLGVLIAARFIQGIGAALITPTSLALIREAYEDAGQRARAVAYWAMGGSIAAAAGPIVGGALTQIDWRIIFFLNIPAGIIALLLLTRVSPSQRHPRPFDWTGQIAAVVGLAALTYAIIEGADGGYACPWIFAAFVIFAAAFVIFLLGQRHGAHPMIPLDMFHSSHVVVALAAAFVGMAGFYGVVFVQSLYFQEFRGEDAFTTGLLFLPMTGLVATLSPVVPRVSARFGLRVPIVGGQTLMAVGLIALACAPATSPVWVIAILMIPVGVGGSFTVPPLTTLLLDSVPAQRADTASGVLNMFRQMGGSLGVAVVGAIVTVQPSMIVGQHIGLISIAVLLLIIAAASVTLRPASTS